MFSRIKSTLLDATEELRRFEWTQLIQFSQLVAAGKWPVSVLGLLTVLFLMAVVFISELLWLQPLRNRVALQMFVVDAIERQLEVEKFELFSGQAGSGLVWQEALVLRAILMHAYAEAGPAVMLDTLRNTAISHGLGVLSLSPGGDFRDGDIYLYDMALQASGDFGSINSFLQALSLLPVHIGLNNFHIKALDESDNSAQMHADFRVAANPSGLFGVPHVSEPALQIKDRTDSGRIVDINLQPAGFLLRAGQQTELWRDASGRLYRRISGTW